MTMKRALTCTLAGAMALAPISRASADTGSFVAGAAIGGLLGHLATKSYNNNQAATVPQTTAPAPDTTTSTASAPKPAARPSMPATDAGREVQSALNFFAFDAGTVDGKVGAQTREAISDYQAYLGYPVTGQLTSFEHDFLTDAHERAMASSVPPGTEEARGLLKVYMAGLSEPQGDAPGGLPTFQVSATPDSLADLCAGVSDKTRANGGYTTIQQARTAPVDVLHEQFCLARTESIANAQAMSAKVADADADEIRRQCAGFGPVMAPMVTGLATEPRDEIVRQAAYVLADSGSNPAQMVDVGEICLGVGYETDDMAVALGSALVLVALGQGAYGELVGHHLAGGFGTPVAPGHAVEWYTAAFDAVDGGQPAVFDPGNPDRITLLETAIDQAYDTSMKPQPVSQPVNGLPTFTTGN